MTGNCFIILRLFLTDRNCKISFNTLGIEYYQLLWHVGVMLSNANIIMTINISEDLIFHNCVKYVQTLPLAFNSAHTKCIRNVCRQDILRYNKLRIDRWSLGSAKRRENLVLRPRNIREIGRKASFLKV